MSVAKRPNFLLVMTDQQRADSVGYAQGMAGEGRGGSDTPLLDSLAQQGVIFVNAYSASTVCVPERTALLTGIFDGQLPLVEGGRVRALKEGHWTIAHAMAGAGYVTGLFGKMHFAPIHARHGFEVVRSCEHLDAGYQPEDADDYRRWLEAQGLADPRGATSFPYEDALHPEHWMTDQAIDFLEAR